MPCGDTGFGPEGTSEMLRLPCNTSVHEGHHHELEVPRRDREPSESSGYVFFEHDEGRVVREKEPDDVEEKVQVIVLECLAGVGRRVDLRLR